MFHPVVIIPVYNHGTTVGAMVASIRAQKLPCILVDDGSATACASVLSGLATISVPAVILLRLPKNKGKGGAMLAGFKKAEALGYSHVLQIDADGQHNPDDIPDFLRMAQQHPAAIINGAPSYDESIPKIRLYGRYLTHIWVWIHTLSFEISDSMCGFRVYPLASTIQLINSSRIGQRMEFDIEILVRLQWQGLKIINIKTPVYYPKDGISHFRFFRDNVTIAKMHTKLFFGMLVRLPLLLLRKIKNPYGKQ